MISACDEGRSGLPDYYNWFLLDSRACLVDLRLKIWPILDSMPDFDGVANLCSGCGSYSVEISRRFLGLLELPYGECFFDCSIKGIL